MSSVIVGDTRSPGRVLGVHGGAGGMHWLRIATGSHLYGEWDGFEWVGFEPGARAGRHVHSHTEEIWFFLRGTGVVELDGVRHDVGPGSLVLTPHHSSHSVHNTGEERLDFMVIEVFPPAISGALPPRRPTEEPDQILLGEDTTKKAGA
ncbi:cupin domain-containing protein [Acrocarpospora sp. B8E8]|uniref:cupin domain-containing protein n=1 Tax=Acrocarpospora sp. B8E8 TaxID=3153572 RepID=UPI00325CBAC7